MQYDTGTYVTAIRAAILAADAADPGEPDGWDENIVAPYLEVPGMSVDQFKDILSSFPPLTMMMGDGISGRIIVLSFKLVLGFRRTRMAEAALESFKASGLTCGLFDGAYSESTAKSHLARVGWDPKEPEIMVKVPPIQ